MCPVPDRSEFLTIISRIAIVITNRMLIHIPQIIIGLISPEVTVLNRGLSRGQRGMGKDQTFHTGQIINLAILRYGNCRTSRVIR